MWQRIQIGIDTGTKTGFAVWDRYEKKFLEIETLKIHQAIIRVNEYCKLFPGQVFVRIEDARLRKWIPRQKNESAEKGRWAGAGSIKRDATMWEGFLKDEKIPYQMIAPKNNKTKMRAALFARITKWGKKTSEHARDAAWLVYQK